eukprot:766842-Hanusia_phi.AAC.14
MLGDPNGCFALAGLYGNEYEEDEADGAAGRSRGECRATRRLPSRTPSRRVGWDWRKVHSRSRGTGRDGMGWEREEGERGRRQKCDSRWGEGEEEEI